MSDDLMIMVWQSGLGFNSIFPILDDFSDAFSDAFSVHYLKVINEIPLRRRTLCICL